MKRLVIGCGYLGRRIANAWRARGDRVWAVTRSPVHAESFARDGLIPLLGDVLLPESLGGLPAVDTVLSAVGFDRSSAASMQDVYVDGLRNLLQSLPAKCGRLIYVSSTSVYGQSNGEWVDESTPCEPTSAGGRICRDAEQVARQSFGGSQGVSVLRLSGIYGPGRLAARIEALRRRQPLSSLPDGWVNLIHVDDACTISLACADFELSVETLVVSDDRPMKRRDYYDQLAAAIGAPPPAFGGSSGRDLGKRCSNRRLHSLGMALAYPTFSEGLKTALRETPL